MKDAPRSGRPRKMTRHIQHQIKVKLKQTRSLRKTQKLLAAAGTSVSLSSIQRERKSVLDIRKPIPKPFRTETHEERRLVFALVNVDRPVDYWRRVLFTDEKMYYTFDAPSHVYVEKGAATPIQPKVKHPPKLQIWGGMSYTGLTKLHRIHHRQKAADYISLLERKMLPDTRRLFSGDWVFMHDSTGHGIHGAKKTKVWLDTNVPSRIDPWPANSPDLNPIENLWGLLTRAVQSRNPKTVEGYWSILRQEWAKIDLEIVQKLVDSLPRRLQAVIESKGGNTKY